MADQKTTVVHCKIEDYDIMIDRTTKWGNPYSHKSGTRAKFKVDTREKAIAKYREWVLTQHHLLQVIESELKGKILGCWCKVKNDPERSCHGDILADLADNGIPCGRTTIDDLD